MDWKSEEGRALLWKAYPDGYLAKRGVLTVGGWTYIDEKCWAAPSCYGIQDWNSVRYPGHSLQKGELLPLPDPTDAATWACLLQDLAEAVNFRNRPKGVAVVPGTYVAINSEYGGVYLRSNAPYYWALCDSYGHRWQWACQCDSPETIIKPYGSYPAWKPDLAEALVTLRAYERECAATAAR